MTNKENKLNKYSVFVKVQKYAIINDIPATSRKEAIKIAEKMYNAGEIDDACWRTTRPAIDIRDVKEEN